MEKGLNLFNIKYKIEVIVSHTILFISLKHRNVEYKVNKQWGHFSFLDPDGIEWIYSKNNVVRNFHSIEIGSYIIGDKKIIRTGNIEDVIQRAEQYFFRFVVRESIYLPQKYDHFFLN